MPFKPQKRPDKELDIERQRALRLFHTGYAVDVEAIPQKELGTVLEGMPVTRLV